MDQAVFSYDPVEAISDWMLRSRSGGFEELMDLGCFIDRGGWWNAREGLENRFARTVDFKNQEAEERVVNILYMAIQGYTAKEIADLISLSERHVGRLIDGATGVKLRDLCQKTAPKCRLQSEREMLPLNEQRKVSPKNGYDRFRTPKEEKLCELFMAEGLPRHKAEIRAKKLRRELKRLQIGEERLWTKVRSFEVHEIPVGEDPTHGRNAGTPA